MACEEEHLNYLGQACPACGCGVDEYGNTEGDFRHCSFPDCGCDGARNCMAKEGASRRAFVVNIDRCKGVCHD